MKTINFINAKGNVQPKVRTAIQKQIKSILKETAAMPLEDCKKGNILVCEVGTDATNGEPIFVTLTVGVTQSHPDNKSQKKEKKTKNVEVPSLF